MRTRNIMLFSMLLALGLITVFFTGTAHAATRPALMPATPAGTGMDISAQVSAPHPLFAQQEDEEGTDPGGEVYQPGDEDSGEEMGDEPASGQAPEVDEPSSDEEGYPLPPEHQEEDVD